MSASRRVLTTARQRMEDGGATPGEARRRWRKTLRWRRDEKVSVVCVFFFFFFFFL